MELAAAGTFKKMNHGYLGAAVPKILTPLRTRQKTSFFHNVNKNDNDHDNNGNHI